MKSQPIEIFATSLQLVVFLSIIVMMNETLFGGSVIQEIRQFAHAFGLN